MKRVLTALALLPVAFYGIFFASQPVFTGIVAVMALLCYYEYTGIVAKQGIAGPLWAGYPMGLLMLLDVPFARLMAAVLLALGLSVRELPKVLLFAATTALGVLYIFGGWRCAIDLRAMGVHWLLFALAVNWAGDIAAFYSGRAFGKHKLAPAVSPGKSWEGAIGSLIAAVLFGYAFFVYYKPTIALPHMLGLSVLANAAGQLGDLAESAIKRGAGVKDSSTLLPGHGGFLDRFDSSIFTMPVVYYYLLYFSERAIS
jgi:phosphatidate cytidylyltransferase